MDIFNWKRVEELEHQLCKMRDIEDENANLRKCLDKATAEITRLLDMQQSVPEDCKRGDWCVSCAFGKEHVSDVHVSVSRHSPGYTYTHRSWLCTKGESCKNFVQKEFKEEPK